MSLIPDFKPSTTDIINSVSFSSVLDELAFYFRGHVLITGTAQRDMPAQSKIMRMVAPSTKKLLRLLYESARCRIRYDVFRASRFCFKIKGDPVADQSPLRFFIPFFFCEPHGKWYARAPFQIDMERSPKAARVLLGGELSGGMTFGGHPTAQIIMHYKSINGGRYTIRRSHTNEPDDKVAEMKSKNYSRRK